MRVGRRVATDGGASNNGEVAADPNGTRVDGERWRLVTIRAEQTWADGTTDTWEVQTLQPVKSLRRRDVDAGESIALDAVLDLKEMGAPEGLVGEVVSIGAAPSIKGGPGRVVLTTVNHLSNFVYDLTLRGSDGELDTLGVTGWHKFYDEADGWQSVAELSLGDTLRGRDGENVTVVSVERDPGVQRVYNLTVEADHVYYVGDLTTLTHNNRCNPLVAQLQRAGVWGRPGDQAAHIVPASGFSFNAGVLAATAHARQTMAAHNISIHSHMNGFRAPVGHLGTHTEAYLLDMSRRVADAGAIGRTALLRELQRLRYDILMGNYL